MCEWKRGSERFFFVVVVDVVDKSEKRKHLKSKSTCSD